MEDILSDHVPDLEDSYSKFKEHTDPDNQMHLINNVFGPAMDGFYDAFKARIDEEVKGGDTALLHKNKNAVKKAIVSGLKAYLGKVRPSALEAIKGVEDELKQYEILTTYIDSELPWSIDKESGEASSKLGSIVKKLIEDEEKKVGDIKIHLWNGKAAAADAHKSVLNSKIYQHHFGHYHGVDIAKFVKKKIETEYEITNPQKFVQLPGQALLSLYKAMDEGEGIQKPSMYGLKKKKD